MVEDTGVSSTRDDAGSGVGGAVYTPLPDGFESLPGGPELRELLSRIQLPQFNGYQMVEVIQAYVRQANHDYGQLLRAVFELAHIPHQGSMDRRRLAGLPVDPPRRVAGEDLGIIDEVAFGLMYSTGRAETLVSLAASVHEFPQLLAALDAGLIDQAKAWLLVEETDLCDPAERARIIDAALAGAELRTTGSLRDRIRKLLYQVDPDLVHKRYQKAVQQRCVQLRAHRDGTASLHGWGLPPDQAGEALSYLSRTAKATKLAGDPDTRFDDRDQRTLGQLRADVMLDLLRGVDPTTPAQQGGAGAVTPAAGKATIVLTVPLTTVLQLNEHPGELAGYGPVVAELARAAMAQLTRNSIPVWRFVLTHEGRVVHEDRLHYRPTAEQAAYVRARDKRCQAPNCRRPASACDIDHINPWNNGGVSQEHQTCLLCRRHHRIKDQGYSLYRTDTGLVWISPHGHAYPVSLGRELDTDQRRLLQEAVNSGEFTKTHTPPQRE